MAVEFGVGFRTREGPKRPVRFGAGVRRIAIVVYAAFVVVMVGFSVLEVSNVYECRLDGMPYGWKQGDALMLDTTDSLVAVSPKDASNRLLLGSKYATPTQVAEAVRVDSAACAQRRSHVWWEVLAIDVVALAAAPLAYLSIAAVMRWVYRGFRSSPPQPPPLDKPT